MLNSKNRYMAIDFGDKRIGLAISDEMLYGTSSTRSVDYLGQEKIAISSIVEECQKQSVSKIVLGYPISMSGEKTEQTKLVEKFCEKLKMALDGSSMNNIEIKYYDERLTSVEAERVLSSSKPGSKLRGESRRQKKDQISASIILNSFLSSNK
jgi:putative Holliday junction resolvase